MNIRQKKQPSFLDILLDLEKKIQRQREYKIFVTLHLLAVLIILVGAVLLFYTGTSQPQTKQEEQSQASSSLPSSVKSQEQEEIEAYAQSLVAKQSADYQFLWTLENYQALSERNQAAPGMTLEELLQNFGAPSEARGYVRVDGIRTIQCRYKSNAFTDDGHPKVVDLNFTEVNGQFELDTKIFIGLGREYFAQASDDSYQYSWTQLSRRHFP